LSAPSASTNLTAWLRERSDDELLTLLRLRPDLGAPAPPDLATLATRIGVRSSLARALDSVDAFALRVLEAIVVLELPGPETSILESLSAGFAEDVLAADLEDGLTRLRDRALIWGDPDRPNVHPGLVELLGPYPAGLGTPAFYLFSVLGPAALTPVLRTLALPPSHEAPPAESIAGALADSPRLAQLLAERTEAEMSLLRRLDAGPPTGQLDAETITALSSGTSGGNQVVRSLLDHALLAQISQHTVELPREVGIALRGGRPFGSVPAHAPDAYASVRDQATVDATASVAVLEILRLVETLATNWSTEPPNQLRSGGLGVRDLRHTARVLGLSEADTAVIAELAVAADLVAAPTARDVPWLPTTDYDTWIQRDPANRWVRLAQAWRTMTRQPHLVGQRDERGKARAALSYEVERSAAPALRSEVLRVLMAAPAGAAGSGELVMKHLAWLMPRRVRIQREALIAVLAEAELIGFTGAGGLSSFGRAVATGTPARAAELLGEALPDPVGEFLLQPDLTLVVPGPPTPDLAREVSLLADLESAGGASVYRITEASMRRAFDAGRAASDIHEMLATRSRTPVPQALTYLIDDLARRYGVLRTGGAVAYLRCDDTALLDRALADRAVAALGWHRLGPTVAVTNADNPQLLATLREAGYAPAAEDRDGVAITIGAEPARARPRRPESARNVHPPSVREDQFTDAIRRMRTGDELSRTAHRVTVTPDIPGVTSATTLGVLREAIRADQRVWVSFVDATGTPSTMILAPLSLGGGFLRGHDIDTREFRSVQLHRITSVNVLTS
jgi:hypothetical protein